MTSAERFRERFEAAVKKSPQTLVCAVCAKRTVGFIGSYSKCCQAVILPVGELQNALCGFIPALDDCGFRNHIDRKTKRIRRLQEMKNQVYDMFTAHNISINVILFTMKRRGFKDITRSKVWRIVLARWIVGGKKHDEPKRRKIDIDRKADAYHKG